MSETASKIDKWLKAQDENREWLAGRLKCSLATLQRQLARPRENTFFIALSKITGIPMDELVPRQRSKSRDPVAV